MGLKHNKNKIVRLDRASNWIIETTSLMQYIWPSISIST